MASRNVWVHNNAAEAYRFHEDHPFHPVRLQLTERLLRAAGAMPDRRAAPLPLDDAERMVRSIHREDFVAAVSALSSDWPSAPELRKAERFGLHADGDTPYFPGMHRAAVAIAAGSMAAAEEVMSGRADRALHLAGGLHHAFPDRASGFCVYNDAAAAIAHVRSEYGARVLYIDTDVHHGDGVQWFFYTDPDVFTLSIHETGKYLFPGSGFAYERGDATGYGSCLNLPVEPYTEDDSWLQIFERALDEAARVFRPDLIISQHGCDAHLFDPLAHICCSMRIYREMPRLIRRLADRCTGGKWVALGGGGYDHWRVVPRAWSLLWMEMSDNPHLADIDAALAGGPLPDNWPGDLADLGRTPDHPLPTTWLDDTSEWTPLPRRAEITAANAKMLELALQHIG